MPIRRPIGLLAAAALALGLGSCAHSEKQAPTPKAATPPPARADEPRGHLSRAEYQSIEREYTLLKPLQSARDFREAVPRTRPACRVLASPRTRLTGLVHADCEVALDFFSALGDLQAAPADCEAPSRLAKEACIAQRYAELGLAIRRVADSASAINQELERRGIGGLCARSIGALPNQVAALKRAAIAAIEAATALQGDHTDAFGQAQKRLDAALGEGSQSDPLAGIRRGCNPDRTQARPAPRKPPRRSSPRPLPRVPRDGGINA